MNIYIEKSRLTQFAQFIKFEDHNIFSSYDIQINEGKIETNIDLFIVGTHKTYNALSEFGHEILSKVVYSEQKKKSSLIANLNSLIKHESFRKMNVYQKPENGDWSQYSFSNDSYFIKYEHGARSLNTFIVDNSKISVASILNKLEKSKGLSKQQYKEKLDEIIGLSGVTYIKGNTRYDGEEYDYSNLDFYPHEQFHDVAKEYRIIQIGYGKEIFCFCRDRNANNNGVVDNEYHYVGEAIELPKLWNILTDLKQYFKSLNMFQGSVDLLMNENQWTIVEMSNQYGMGDIKPHRKEYILSQAIKFAIEHIDNTSYNSTS